MKELIGKKDIDGVEMREGDIIADVIGKFATVIFFDDKREEYVAGSGFINKEGKHIPCVISDSPFLRRKKVIGSIYEDYSVLDKYNGKV